MTQIIAEEPFTHVRIDVARTEDWTDDAPQLLDADGAPVNLNGCDLRLFVRPTFDHQIAVLTLSRAGGIIVTDEANGLFQFGVTREGLAAVPLLPNGSAATYDQFLILERIGTPTSFTEIWRGPFVIHPGRTA